MVLIRRKPIRGRLVKALSYGLIIATLGGLALGVYLKHRAARYPVTVTPPSGPEAPTVAGLDRRLIFASDPELLAPPAFPWSLAAVSRTPRAEITALRIVSAPEEVELPANLPERLASALAEQAPVIARPYTLPASPPYLVTPLTFEIEFELDETGAASAAAVAGAPGELNGTFAERAARFLFPQAAAEVGFAATVTLIPYAYDRLAATRRGQAVPEEEYRSLFRALQFNSFPLYDTCLAAAPELLTAEEGTAVAFQVNAEGHPAEIGFDPPLSTEEAADTLAAALAEISLPPSLAGARVEFLLGG